MSTTEPKAGEWWERGWPCTLADCPIGLFEYQGELCLKTEYGTNDGRIDAYIVSSGEFFWGGGGIAGQRKVMVTPVQVRIPDPPAPEPSETERVDAMLEAALARLFPHASQGHCREAGAEIRKSIENAGYVLVPTSGPGFERRLTAAKRATVYRGDIYSPATVMVEDGIRAFLEAAKGDAR